MVATWLQRFSAWFDLIHQRKRMRVALQQLKLLNDEIFACLLQPAYANNIYLFERRIHQQKRRFLQFNTQKLLPLYIAMLDYGQLRWRVTDHTIFALCQAELLSLQTEINNLLIKLAHLITINDKTVIDTTALDESIMRFVDSDQTILQTTAREPVVWMLFVFSLQQLSEKIKQIDL